MFSGVDKIHLGSLNCDWTLGGNILGKLKHILNMNMNMNVSVNMNIMDDARRAREDDEYDNNREDEYEYDV